jgi:hypothetical protein
MHCVRILDFQSEERQVSVTTGGCGLAFSFVQSPFCTSIAMDEFHD